jgi:proteasome accessory factor C
MPGRLAKLETAISKQRTVKFSYRAMTSGKETERTLNPYGLLHDRGVWYVVGNDLDRGAIRTFRVARILGDIRFATRRERDFRVPQEFDIDSFRGRASWQFGDPAGEARIEVRPETAWWVERAFGRSGRLEGDVFVTPYSNVALLASWVLRQDGRAVPLSPADLRREVADSLRRVRTRHEGPPSRPAREAPTAASDFGAERTAGPVTPERFGLLQALLAYLLAACGEEREAVIPAADLVERFQIPYEELEDHLSLLNLVNFGGGCYAVYAELHGDEVHVDKELFGDTFRSAPRLTPLEARAIRLALEFVGPLIAAEAHRPLDRVRAKLEETFGEFELSQTPEPDVGGPEEALVATLTEGIRRRRLVEIEYLKEEEGTPFTHLVEPYTIERRLPHWYVHTWDRTRNDERSFRLDRMRNARLTDEEFESRDEFEPGVLSGTLVARVLYSSAVARWEVERGATPLADGSAINEQKIGSPEWLVGEILRYRGEAELLEPPELRRRIAERARTLARDLGVTRLRTPA